MKNKRRLMDSLCCCVVCETSLLYRNKSILPTGKE